MECVPIPIFVETIKGWVFDGWSCDFTEDEVRIRLTMPPLSFYGGRWQEFETQGGSE